MGISTNQLEVTTGVVYGTPTLPGADTLPSGLLLPSDAGGAVDGLAGSLVREITLGIVGQLETGAGSMG